MEFEQSPRDCISVLVELDGTDAVVPVEWNTRKRGPMGCPILVIPALCSRQQILSPGGLETRGKKNSKWSRQKRKNDEC